MHTLLAGMQNGTISLENGWAVSSVIHVLHFNFKKLNSQFITLIINLMVGGVI